MSSTAVALTPTKSLRSVNQSLSLSSQQKSTANSALSQSTQSQQPQTPRTQRPILPAQPGTWRHPQIDEIVRRQNQSVFNGENVRRAIHHGILLIASLLVPIVTEPYQPRLLKDVLGAYNGLPLDVVRLFFVLNFIYCFRPLFQKQDGIEDIPLTPSQRSLLGLKPSSTPATPGSQYITPPRYSRSATPRSSLSDRTNRSPVSSPSDGRGRSGSVDRGFAQSTRTLSGSPYGPSPLVQKALTGSASRRSSMDANGTQASPVLGPGHGKASVGLNNKWLYERGRGSLTGRNLFS